VGIDKKCYCHDIVDEHPSLEFEILRLAHHCTKKKKTLLQNEGLCCPCAPVRKYATIDGLYKETQRQRAAAAASEWTEQQQKQLTPVRTDGSRVRSPRPIPAGRERIEKELQLKGELKKGAYENRRREIEQQHRRQQEASRRAEEPKGDRGQPQPATDKWQPSERQQRFQPPPPKWPQQQQSSQDKERSRGPDSQGKADSQPKAGSKERKDPQAVARRAHAATAQPLGKRPSSQVSGGAAEPPAAKKAASDPSTATAAEQPAPVSPSATKAAEPSKAAAAPAAEQAESPAKAAAAPAAEQAERSAEAATVGTGPPPEVRNPRYRSSPDSDQAWEAKQAQQQLIPPGFNAATLVAAAAKEAAAEAATEKEAAELQEVAEAAEGLAKQLSQPVAPITAPATSQRSGSRTVTLSGSRLSSGQQQQEQGLPFFHRVYLDGEDCNAELGSWAGLFNLSTEDARAELAVRGFNSLAHLDRGLQLALFRHLFAVTTQGTKAQRLLNLCVRQGIEASERYNQLCLRLQ